MKKFFNLLAKFTVISLISVFLITANTYAEDENPSSWFPEGYQDVLTANNIPAPEGSKGIAEGVVMVGLEYVKLLTVIVGILYLTILGYTLVVSGDNEEQVSKAKKGIIYTLIAFLMISMSEDFSEIFRMGDGKQLLTKDSVSSRIRVFDAQVELFLKFIYYIVGGYASIMVVRSGIKLVTSGGNEETVSKHKKGVMYSIAGLLLLYVGDSFIKRVFYVTDMFDYEGSSGSSTSAITIDVDEGVVQLASITNFLVKFIGPISVFVLMIGSIMYATAGGDEEKMNKAKRLVIATVVGMLIIYGAFAIVSTFIAADLQQTDVDISL